MLALLVGTFGACLLLGRRVLPLVYWSASGAFLGFLIWAAMATHLFVAEGSPANAVSSQSGDSGRYYLWNIAKEHIVSSPVLGIGPMHFADVMNAKAAHPHNIYLQVAAEWGIPAFFILITITISSFVRFISLVKRQSNPAHFYEGAGIVATWIAIATDGFFSGNFVMPASQVWIAFFAGWALAFWRSTAPESPPPRNQLPPLGPIRVLISTVLLVWLWYSVLPEIQALEAHLQRQFERFPPVQRSSPRFWSHGWF